MTKNISRTVSKQSIRSGALFGVRERNSDRFATANLQLFSMKQSPGLFFLSGAINFLRSLLRKQVKTRIIAIDIYRSIYWRGRIYIGRSQRDDKKEVRHGAKT